MLLFLFRRRNLFSIKAKIFQLSEEKKRLKKTKVREEKALSAKQDIQPIAKITQKSFKKINDTHEQAAKLAK